MPVSVATWYSGRDGTTVGMGATELVASGMVPVAAMAWTGSTIMLAVVVLLHTRMVLLMEGMMVVVRKEEEQRGKKGDDEE